MTLESRVRGCILGAALGDAIGGPFEFGPLERAPQPGGWIDGLYPYLETIGPYPLDVVEGAPLPREMAISSTFRGQRGDGSRGVGWDIRCLVGPPSVRIETAW